MRCPTCGQKECCGGDYAEMVEKLQSDLEAARTAVMAASDWMDDLASVDGALAKAPCQEWRGCKPGADPDTPRCPVCLVKVEVEKIYAAAEKESDEGRAEVWK